MEIIIFVRNLEYTTMTRIYSFLTLLCLYLFVSCTYNKHVEPLLAEAESLVQSSPDSAYRLLAALPVDSGGWSCGQVARYGLLLARATDKCMKPLLPCDSLLDVALEYYADNTPHRAMALLYKGRLEKEMGQQEEATRMFQEAWTILKDKSGEAEMKRLVLSSLGNQYFDVGSFDLALPLYRKLYQYSLTDKDKAIALDNLCNYYALQENKDSVFAIRQKALHHARLSGDSLIVARLLLSLSMDYNLFGSPDTTLIYARQALANVPYGENRSMYYYNLGDMLALNSESCDSAAYYLDRSREGMALGEKVMSLLSSSELAEQMGDYKAATEYLKLYVDYLDSLTFSEQTIKMENLIHEYDTKMRVQEERVQNYSLMWGIISVAFGGCCLIVWYFMARLEKKKQRQKVYEQRLAYASEKMSVLQRTIEDNNSIIALLQQKHYDLEEKSEKVENEIKKRESVIENLQEEKNNLQKWLFEQSAIYKKIIMLRQQSSDSRKQKVLTVVEQKELKSIVFSLYGTYLNYLQGKYSRLTEDDLLLLCLKKTSLDNKSIAICFGYGDTHAINQRNLRIKERMRIIQD